jgi:hypothetical protein
MQSSAIRVGARLYSIVSLDDENFDILLSQKNVHDSAIKSFVDYDEQLIVIRDRLSQEHKSLFFTNFCMLAQKMQEFRKIRRSRRSSACSLLV